MPSDRLDPALLAEIKALKSGRVRRATPEEIVSVVEAVIDGMYEHIPTVGGTIRDDLQDLADYIRATKADIMNLKPEEIADEHLPKATGELDAIVEATEQATHAIMEAAEEIERAAAHMDAAQSEVLINATTRIYEACSFQDITGQRVSKVIGALKEIEGKVDALVVAFGDEDEESVAARREQRQRDRERRRREAIEAGDLREGPQMPSDAISQNDIDALFASLD